MLDENGHRLVFVDLEVAGGELSRPIIQVAAIAVAGNFQEIEAFEAKLKFDLALADPGSLTNKRYCPATWAAEARSATVVARQFARFLRRHATFTSGTCHSGCRQVAQLVAHNAQFDGPFLQAWFDRVGRYFPGDYRMLCTVQRALWLFHEYPHLSPPRDFKLVTLCRYFGVQFPPEKTHTALFDVRATVELYRRITLLATAEIANGMSRRSFELRAPRRVARVALSSRQTCRSRRRSKHKACRSRRSPQRR